MGVCDCFKRISRIKRKKENMPIKLKDSVNSTHTKNGYSMENELGFRVSHREAISADMGTKELAATRIQSSFRAYKARKTVCYLKAISRCRDALTKQTSTALERLHIWSKIQAEINNRRRCMVTEDPLRQLKVEDWLKIESELHEPEMAWCDGSKTMVETRFKIQHREEATNRRERALAYAFSHQWRANSCRYFGQAYYDLSKENWGWKWSERWIAVYRLEAHVVVRPIVSQRAGASEKNKTKMMVNWTETQGKGKSCNL